MVILGVVIVVFYIIFYVLIVRVIAELKIGCRLVGLVFGRKGSLK